MCIYILICIWYQYKSTYHNIQVPPDNWDEWWMSKPWTITVYFFRSNLCDLFEDFMVMFCKYIAAIHLMVGVIVHISSNQWLILTVTCLACKGRKCFGHPVPVGNRFSSSNWWTWHCPFKDIDGYKFMILWLLVWNKWNRCSRFMPLRLQPVGDNSSWLLGQTGGNFKELKGSI